MPLDMIPREYITFSIVQLRMNNLSHERNHTNNFLLTKKGERRLYTKNVYVTKNRGCGECSRLKEVEEMGQVWYLTLDWMPHLRGKNTRYTGRN